MSTTSSLLEAVKRLDAEQGQMLKELSRLKDLVLNSSLDADVKEKLAVEIGTIVNVIDAGVSAKKLRLMEALSVRT